MKERLRSAGWYAGRDRNAYIHRAWMRRGAPDSAFEGRPQIAIANTASDLTPCNAHMDGLARSVANGVWEAGGVPLNLPVVSLGETQVKPTAMLWRNMAAMAAEEMFRANPIDGLVLLGGCDKTIPSLLMAAASVDLPSVVLPGGPMLTGTFQGQVLNSATDVWRLSEEVRAGTMPEHLFLESESCLIRSRGHCNAMGTASTMALVTEALGMILPGTAGLPAPDSRLLRAAHETGRLAVRLVEDDRRPSTFLTEASFRNAIVALAAIGGSTNAVVHLLAIAGRLRIPLTLEDFDRIGSGVPLLADLQPAGRYLMDDLHRAGGLLAVLREVIDLLDPSALTVSGRPLVEHVAPAVAWDREVIRPREEPLQADAGIAVLRGNLAPDGAIIKPAAATPALLTHRGRAVVFDSIEDFHARVDDPDLDIDADSMMVLRGCGPKGYPGMPEVANLPLPAKLLAHGVRDMVRVCDGRMSGTAYGTVVLHVAPEAAAGGPLALVRTGDWIELDVPVGDSPSTCRRTSSPRAPRARPRRPGTRTRSAAGSASTSTTSCRPTRARTSTSCSGPAAPVSSASRTDRLSNGFTFVVDSSIFLRVASGSATVPPPGTVRRGRTCRSIRTGPTSSPRNASSSSPG